MSQFEVIVENKEKEREEQWHQRNLKMRVQRDQDRQRAQSDRLAIQEKKQADWESRQEALAQAKRNAKYSGESVRKDIGSFFSQKRSSQGSIPVARIARHPDEAYKSQGARSFIEQSGDFWGSSLGGSGSPLNNTVGSSFNWGLGHQKPARSSKRKGGSSWKKNYPRSKTRPGGRR